MFAVISTFTSAYFDIELSSVNLDGSDVLIYLIKIIYIS